MWAVSLLNMILSCSECLQCLCHLLAVFECSLLLMAVPCDLQTSPAAPLCRITGGQVHGMTWRLFANATFTSIGVGRYTGLRHLPSKVPSNIGPPEA